MRIRQLSPWFCLLLVLSFAGCGGGDGEPMADQAEPAAAAEDQDGGEMAGGHAHPDPDDADGWRKPTEVYDFVGIEEGDVVVDVMAGGGYHSVRAAERVGPEGAVIAERGSEDLMVAVEAGEAPANIEVVGGLEAIDDGRVDAVLAIRAYHLFPDVPAMLAEMMRVMKPGGVVGIVEVRLNEEYGHDMTSHRMGEQTVIEDMESAGFEYVGSSDLLRVEGDDYTSFRAGERHMADRMLLKFRKPE